MSPEVVKIRICTSSQNIHVLVQISYAFSCVLYILMYRDMYDLMSFY
jgi:hypothetical protein